VITGGERRMGNPVKTTFTGKYIFQAIYLFFKLLERT
jgi:hypothetical protein